MICLVIKTQEDTGINIPLKDKGSIVGNASVLDKHDARLPGALLTISTASNICVTVNVRVIFH